MKNTNNTYIKETTTSFQINDMNITVKGNRRFDSTTNEILFDYDLDNRLLIEAGKIYRQSIHFDGEELIKFRKDNNLTQALLAKILGISRKTLISYERNYALPNNQNLKIIQSLLKDETMLEKMTSNFITPLTYKEMEIVGNIRVEESVDEYNGYQHINKELLIDLILYFTEKGISITRLEKALFYADFLNYKNSGSSLTGLYYRKLQFGPYSEHLIKVADDLFQVGKLSKKLDHLLVSTEKSNLSFLNEIQSNFIERIRSYIEKNDAKTVSEDSHRHEGWLKTPDYEKISYDFALELDDSFLQA